MAHKNHAAMRTVDLARDIMNFLRSPKDPLLERDYIRHVALLVGTTCQLS